jgi:uncharacterized iron-regulated membrane protein
MTAPVLRATPPGQKRDDTTMNIVNKPTILHLRLNRGRTIITVIGIVLSVAMVCCVAGFLVNTRDLANRLHRLNTISADKTPT